MTDKEMQDVKVRLITGLYSRGDISMVFAEIERLQAEIRRLKKSVDNQCDDCACEIANERDKAIKDLVEEDWRNRNARNKV